MATDEDVFEKERDTYWIRDIRTALNVRPRSPARKGLTGWSVIVGEDAVEIADGRARIVRLKDIREALARRPRPKPIYMY